MSSTTNFSAIRKNQWKVKVLYLFRALAFFSLMFGALYIVGAEHMSDEEFWNHALIGALDMAVSMLLYLVLTFLEAYYAGDID